MQSRSRVAAFLWVGLVTAVGAGCATIASEGSAAKGPQRTFYTLRSGERTSYGRPLPSRTDVYVDWHYDSGAVQTYTGFRGWDFLGDGRFGMLEVMTEDGNVQEYIYDFAGDGRPQITKRADGKGAEAVPETE